MGIRKKKTHLDLRGCLDVQSGYTGDTTTKEGRDGLKTGCRLMKNYTAESEKQF